MTCSLTQPLLNASSLRVQTTRVGCSWYKALLRRFNEHHKASTSADEANLHSMKRGIGLPTSAIVRTSNDNFAFDIITKNRGEKGGLPRTREPRCRPGNELTEHHSSRLVPFSRREVVASLIEEYKACESANYVNWGMSGGGDAAASGAQAGKDSTASAT